VTDIWPVVHAERAALGADLERLSDDQWDTPSLCSRWTVRDVVAHMTATAKVTPTVFLPKLIGSGFRLGRMQAKDIAAERGDSPKDTLVHFDQVTLSTRRPPGPDGTILGETIIHCEDVRRALGIERTYPMTSVVEVADFYKKSNLVIGVKRRIDGLELRATDTEWSFGSGPLVSGQMLDLLMAMTGRTAAADRLSGDGLAILRER
jgi:uncharacterized protein (TIGR03083 family)